MGHYIIKSSNTVKRFIRIVQSLYTKESKYKLERKQNITRKRELGKVLAGSTVVCISDWGIRKDIYIY